jgi:hypothetical protein
MFSEVSDSPAGPCGPHLQFSPDNRRAGVVSNSWRNPAVLDPLQEIQAVPF